MKCFFCDGTFQDQSLITFLQSSSIKEKYHYIGLIHRYICKDVCSAQVFMHMGICTSVYQILCMFACIYAEDSIPKIIIVGICVYNV